jgi:hypothetical protein
MSLTTDEREFAKMMYEEHAEHARLHEELRAAATSLIIALISGLLAALFFFENQRHGVAGGLAIGGLSILGIVLNVKHYERYVLHRDIVRGFRETLQQDLSPAIQTLAEKRRKAHEGAWPAISAIRLHLLWLSVYLFTLGIGGFIVYKSAARDIFLECQSIVPVEPRGDGSAISFALKCKEVSESKSPPTRSPAT